MNLKDYFDRLTLRSIHQMVEDRQTEELWLEFKIVSSSEMKREDRQNLAKAVSGFSNSSGGIVIWGVEARDNEDGVDCAVAIREIDTVDRFYSRLNDITGQIAVPIANGVVHRRFRLGNKKGLAATLVPESDGGPHMAKAGLDRYFKRSGSSFYPMEHFDIADMFGRRKRPKLSLDCQLAVAHYGGIPTGQCSVTLKPVISIVNEGRGTAKFAFLSMSIRPPYVVSHGELTGNGGSGLPRVNSHERTKRQYAAGVDTVIHPGVSIAVTQVGTITIKDTTNTEPADLVIEYDLGAEDLDFTRGEFRTTGKDILAFAMALLEEYRKKPR
jgi:hypothetical protein